MFDVLVRPFTRLFASSSKAAAAAPAPQGRRHRGSLSAIIAARKSIPVDLDTVAASLGMVLSYIPMEARTCASIDKVNGLWVVHINKTHSEVRRRYALAVCLGHIFLHSPDEHLPLSIDRAWRVRDVDGDPHCDLGRDHVTRANRFAVSLLMPADQVVRMYGAHGGAPYPAVTLSRLFKTSPRAMDLRIDGLRQLGRL